MGNKAPETALARALKWVHRAEDLLLVGMLLAMILLATFQILLRNLWGGGVVWGDSLVRIGVGLEALGDIQADLDRGLQILLTEPSARRA